MDATTPKHIVESGLLKSILQDNNGLNPTDIHAVKNMTYPLNVLTEPFIIIYVNEYPDVIANPVVRYILIAIHITLSLMTIIGNTLVIVVVSKRKSLRRNTAIVFILNLAICDLMSCILYRPLLLVNLILPFTDSNMDYHNQVAVCRALTFLQSVFAGVGFHTIVAISMERLCLIVFPLKAKVYFASNRTKKVLVIVWIITLGLALPVPLKFAKLMVMDLGGGTTMTYCGQFEFTSGGMVYFTTMFFLYFAIPLMIIAASYTKIFNTLYMSHTSLNVHEHEEANEKQMQVRRSLAKMMLAVAVIFALCWGPHFAFFLHASIGGKIPKNGFLIATIIELLPLVSSTLNPFIYTINSRTFRIGLKSLFMPGRRLSRKDESVFRTFNNGTSLHGRASVASKVSGHNRMSVGSRVTSTGSSSRTSGVLYEKVDLSPNSKRNSNLLDQQDRAPRRKEGRFENRNTFHAERSISKIMENRNNITYGRNSNIYQGSYSKVECDEVM